MQTIDLGTKQRAIMQEIQADEAQLAQLQRMIEATTARLNGNRGKLALIAALLEEYGAPVSAPTITHGEA
jgi:hypothetical protein